MENIACDVCRNSCAVGVAGSAMGPCSWAYCSDCISHNAEPIPMFDFTYECCGDEVSEWVRSMQTYHHGEYVSWDKYVSELAEIRKENKA